MANNSVILPSASCNATRRAKKRLTGFVHEIPCDGVARLLPICGHHSVSIDTSVPTTSRLAILKASGSIWVSPPIEVMRIGTIMGYTTQYGQRVKRARRYPSRSVGPGRRRLVSRAGRSSTMLSNRNDRRLMAGVGAAGLIAMSALIAGCGGNGTQAPPTSATTTSTTSATPTDKDISPSGGNLFTPQVIAPPARLEPPGVHRHKH